MVLKGLAVGGAIAIFAVVVFAALLLRPAAPAASVVAEPALSGNVVLLPNGVAAPQLRPAQPDSAPAFVDTTGQKSLVGMGRLNSVADSFTLSDLRSSSAATEEKLLMGCGGN